VKDNETDDTLERICTTCGKRVGPGIPPSASTAQSFVSQDCCCAQSNVDSQMNLRFWQLKEAGKGTVFVSSSSAAESSGVTAIGLAAEAIIGGIYKIIRLIGRGGMGEVYLAEHLTLGKKCALKVIPPDQVTEVSWQRFQLEAKTVASLDHVNLVRVTDLGLHEGCLPFYCMEYIEGENLAEMLEAYGPMPIDKALEVFMQVCDGVECAHRSGILHRDLKPANIMLTRTPTGKLEVKVLDFGLAKLTKHDRFKQSLTAVGDVFGSPSYMSPEHCAGDALDSRSDIYSIGCTFFEALAGRPPFQSHVPGAVFFGHLESTPPSLGSVCGGGKFPQSMELVMAKLLRKDPAARYQTLSELKADLAPILAGNASPPGPAEKAGAATGGQTKRTAAARSQMPVTAAAQRRGLNLPLLAFISLVLLAMAGSLVYSIVPLRNKQVGRAVTVFAPAKGLGGPTNKEDGVVATSAVGARADSNGPKIGQPLAYPGSVSDLSKANANATVEWDGKPFFKGTLNRAGQSYRHFVFPKVSANPSYFQYGLWPRVKQAALSEDVLIPVSQPLCLVPVSYISAQPFMINGLSDGDFDEIDLLMRDPEVFDSGLTALTKFKSIRSIRFGGLPAWEADLPKAGERAVALINKFPNLDRLIAFAPLSADCLGRLQRLKALREIRLQGPQPDLLACLKLLGGSETLESFAASSWLIQPDNLAILSTCPHLQRLLVGRLTGSHEEIALLAGFPHLSLLEMPFLKYRPELAADLKPLKSLKELRFTRATWTNEQIGQLRQELPGLKLTLYRNFIDEMNALRQP
jgi:hypothetical protein